MYVKKITGLAFLLVLIFTPFANSMAANEELNVQVHLDPESIKNEKLLPVWLGYVLGRAAYIDEHPELYRGQKGSLIPRYDEEVEARAGATEIYLELKEKDKTIVSRYFDELAKIKAAGFMREYVWLFLHQNFSASSPTTERIAQFNEWVVQNAPEHKVETYGSITLK